MIIVNPLADYSGLGLGRAFAPITPEVESIMANYSGATDKMAAALALFFANIGDTLKAKIKCAFFPIFASNKNECLYSYVQDAMVYPSYVGSTGLYFDADNKLLQCDALSTYWNRYTFPITNLFGSGATREGSHSILQIMPSSNGSLTRSAMGISYKYNNWGLTGDINWGTDYTKFIGLSCHDVASDGSSGIAGIFADRGFAKTNSAFTSFGNNYTPFGQNTEHSEGRGSRVVVFVEGATFAEEYKIRDAILALDNAFFA